MPRATIPYPPVFHDWEHEERRVATFSGMGGVGVEMFLNGHVWKRVELTEGDACLLAASLLQRAGKPNLSKRVLRAVGREGTER